MKKVLLIFAIACVLCVSVLASDSIVFTYDILPDGTAAITGASGLEYSCEIPKELDGYTVTALGNGSPLVGFDEIDSVSLYSNVTKIADKAFYGNKKLEYVYNSTYLTTVGDYAFYNCEKLKGFNFEGLEYIGEGAFAYCKSLGGIDSRIKLDSLKSFDGAEYPYLLNDGSYGYNTLAEAEKAPFYGCDGLTSVQIHCSSFYLPMEIMFLDCRRITHATVYDFNGSLNAWDFMVTSSSPDGKLSMNFHPNAIMFTAYGNAAKSYAESKYMVYIPMYSAAKVFVDGEEIVSDQEALLMNSRTMVPLRAIFEKLGAEVFWNDETRTVKAVKDGKEIELTIGMNHMRAGKKIVYLDVTPLLFNSRTLVPLRAVSEAFDNEVLWDGDTRTVTVESKPVSEQMHAKKDIIKAENGDVYTVFYDNNGKRLCVQKDVYASDGELVSTEITEEYTYDIYGNLTKKVHPDGTVEEYKYDFLQKMTDYTLQYPNGSFKKYHYSKQNGEYLLYMIQETGDNPETGIKETHLNYNTNVYKTLSEIYDNYGLSLKFYYVDEHEYESDTYKTANEFMGLPRDYVIVVSDDKIVDKFKGGVEKYTNVEFYNVNGDKYADVYELGEVIETVTDIETEAVIKSTEKFMGINYEKAVSTGKDAKFIPSVSTMFEGENSLASDRAFKAFPIHEIGEDTTLFSAATILCDTMYNFDYRDIEALASVGERMKTATDLANGNPQAIRGGVMYSFPRLFDAAKNVEKKVVSEAFFASSPENCIQLEGPMPQCLLQTIKGYLYIKYDSFDDPDFTLELGKWYRTEVEITFGYTQTPSSGIYHTVSIASLGFEEVPGELLVK